MNSEPQRITVNLGNRTLNLRPLGRRDFDAAVEVARSIQGTVHGPTIDPWLKDCGDALGFIFVVMAAVLAIRPSGLFGTPER